MALFRRLKFVFVVLGVRNVGCLLANRLSANPENRLLLIEHQPGEGIGPWCQEIGMC